jgi:hypothetical protein
MNDLLNLVILAIGLMCIFVFSELISQSEYVQDSITQGVYEMEGVAK